MTFKLNGYKVFIASPGGLEDERRAFAKEIETYNKIEALHRNVMFQAVGWEDTLSGMGRPQSLINEDLKQCDYFILVLHDRWGSNPGVNKKEASSGTEEEYLIALDCFYDKNLPMKQIICLFKSVPPNQLADPGPQLQDVVNFKRKLEHEKKLLYSNFSSNEEFTSLIRKNLSKWLRDDNSPEEGGYILPKDSPIPPDDNGPTSGGSDLIDTDIEKDLEKAWLYAKEGKLVDAEIEFSKALIKDPSENQLLNFSNFLMDIGQLDKSMVMIDRAIHLATAGNNLAMKAKAYSYKGIILKIRGNLDEAKDMYKKALEINEKLGRLEGIASNYKNLGNIMLDRGDLEGAEDLYKKALEINKDLERLEGITSIYNNLGNIMLKRGDLEGAEDLYKKALEINKDLERLEGITSSYNNLGNIMLKRGDLEGAEDMYKKALEINERLGRLEGITSSYNNLGYVLQNRGDLDEAEDMYKKALEINEKLGRLEGIASNYGNLGYNLKLRGDLDGAEKMLKKALEINIKLGRLEGMAHQYGNLGVILKTKGDLDEAEEMYKKALEIATKIGLTSIIEKVNHNLQILKKEQ